MSDEAEALRDQVARLFPIQGGPAIPWAVIAPCEAQADRNHGQTLERLAERQGLSPCEAVAVLEGREWHKMGDAAANARLAEIVKERAYLPEIDRLTAALTQERSLREKAERELAEARQVYHDTQWEQLKQAQAALAETRTERDRWIESSRTWGAAAATSEKRHAETRDRLRAFLSLDWFPDAAPGPSCYCVSPVSAARKAMREAGILLNGESPFPSDNDGFITIFRDGDKETVSVWLGGMAYPESHRDSVPSEKLQVFDEALARHRASQDKGT